MHCQTHDEILVALVNVFKHILNLVKMKDACRAHYITDNNSITGSLVRSATT